MRRKGEWGARGGARLFALFLERDGAAQARLDMVHNLISLRGVEPARAGVMASDASAHTQSAHVPRWLPCDCSASVPCHPVLRRQSETAGPHQAHMQARISDILRNVLKVCRPSLGRY